LVGAGSSQELLWSEFSRRIHITSVCFELLVYLDFSFYSVNKASFLLPFAPSFPLMASKSFVAQAVKFKS
jgi:hypothetical protein